MLRFWLVGKGSAINPAGISPEMKADPGELYGVTAGAIGNREAA